MLATQEEYRGCGIATVLVKKAVDAMIAKDADEVPPSPLAWLFGRLANLYQIALETEVDNLPSLRIYENLGFLRTKRLHRYYLNGNTAFRLILYLKPGIPYKQTFPPEFPPHLEAQSGARSAGRGLMEEDLVVRQLAASNLE